MAVLNDSQTAAESAVPEWLRAGESRLRLQTIVRLRWLAVLGQTLTVIAVHWGLGMELPLGGCFAAIALSAWLNVILRIRFPASQRLSSRAAFLMLGYDILQLAGLLYLTGGIENPFAFLMVAPVTVSAATLPSRITLALALLAIAAASVLVVHHYPLPWFSDSQLDLPVLYRYGFWTSVVLGIIFIGFYSWRTAEEGKRMAEALAATETVLAREQKLSALDGMAAAAAHGLGTPLATIAVVTKELLRDAKKSDASYDDLLLLRTQAERCRDILRGLAAPSEEFDFIVSRMPASHLIDEIVEPYRPLSVPIRVTAEPQSGAAKGDALGEPVIQRNPGVIYGLGNLLENAVDFASDEVTVDATWSQDEVRIVIADDGKGFPVDVLEQLGEPFITTRPGKSWGEEEPDQHTGMGLGFFIAKTLLERSGARIALANRPEPDSGAVVTVVWPRTKFETSA